MTAIECLSGDIHLTHTVFLEAKICRAFKIGHAQVLSICKEKIGRRVFCQVTIFDFKNNQVCTIGLKGSATTLWCWLPDEYFWEHDASHDDTPPFDVA